MLSPEPIAQLHRAPSPLDFPDSPLSRAVKQPMMLGLFLPTQTGGFSQSTLPRSTNWHFEYNRDLTLAAFAIDPSTMMIAVAKQVRDFAMPGTGIPSFTRHAVRIAREGIYGLKQFLRDVLDPVLGLWDVEHLAGLSAEAEKARQDLAEFVAKLGEGVDRMAQKAAAAAALA